MLGPERMLEKRENRCRKDSATRLLMAIEDKQCNDWIRKHIFSFASRKCFGMKASVAGWMCNIFSRPIIIVLNLKSKTKTLLAKRASGYSGDQGKRLWLSLFLLNTTHLWSIVTRLLHILPNSLDQFSFEIAIMIIETISFYHQPDYDQQKLI